MWPVAGIRLSLRKNGMQGALPTTWASLFGTTRSRMRQGSPRSNEQIGVKVGHPRSVLAHKRDSCEQATEESQAKRLFINPMDGFHHLEKMMSCNNDSVYEVDLGVTLSAYKTILLSAANDDEAIQTAKTLHDAQALSSLTSKPWKAQWDAFDDERVVFLRNTKTGAVLLEDYRGDVSGDVGGASEVLPDFAGLTLPLLPQAFELSKLLEAAQAALPFLKDGNVKSELAKSIAVFSGVVAPTTWCVDDVTDQRPDLSVKEARQVLFMMAKRHQCTESDWALLSNLSEGVRKRPQELEPGAKATLRSDLEADSVVYPQGTALTVVEPEQGDNGAAVAYLVDLHRADGSLVRASVESWQIEHPLESAATQEGQALTD